MSKLTLLCTMIVIAFAPTAWAGWVVEYASGDITYISSGKMKQVSKEDGTSSLLDGKTGQSSMLNPGKKIYWQGSGKDFCATMLQLIPQLEQKPAKPGISIKPAGNETIAGISTKKYQVMADGQLAREVWIAKNQELANESKAFNRLTEEFTTCYPAQTTEEMVDRDPAYLKLGNQGFVMKEVTYINGNMPVSNDEVVNLRQENIADSEFEVPAGFRRVESLMEMYQ